MRPTQQIVHSRAIVRSRFALLPAEGFPPSTLPEWSNTAAKILCSPALGAGFAMYDLDVQPGGGCRHAADGVVETFIYVLSGLAALTTDLIKALTPGAFALLPPDVSFTLSINQPTRLLMVRKRYEPLGSHSFTPVFGDQSNVPADVWMGIPQAKLLQLIPDTLPFDLAMNVFSFDPGFGLPYVETHVMEHGLLMLQGKGVYYLDGQWLEVETGDFIWMAPYCPQSFYATGPTAAKYIYYKNVNRDVTL